jgi:hypothetical protein
LTDRAGDVSEAIWELERRYGLGLSVPDQVSIARILGSSPPGSLTLAHVASAFRSQGLKPPPRGYADALSARVHALAPRQSLINVLLDYRKFAIRELSGQFGGRTAGREEDLRNNLLTFLPERGYTEARTGRGRTDILLTAPKRIIEVKVWGSMLVYEDGLVELGRYIQTEEPEAAYMVVFGDRVPLPLIIEHHAEAIADQRQIENIVVTVVVVPFEVDQASKAAANDRRRARGGR